MQGSGRMTPWDKSTHYSIIKSETPVDVDGYKIGEPKKIRCDGCGAEELLTPDPSAGVDDLQHDRDCPQRFARSEWWARHLQGMDDVEVAADGGRER